LEEWKFEDQVVCDVSPIYSAKKGSLSLQLYDKGGLKIGK